MSVSHKRDQQDIIETIVLSDSDEKGTQETKRPPRKRQRPSSVRNEIVNADKKVKNARKGETGQLNEVIVISSDQEVRPAFLVATDRFEHISAGY